MCHTCKKLEGKDDLGAEKLRAEHALKCKMNYSGSAPAMEPECAKRTFSQKKTRRKILIRGQEKDRGPKQGKGRENLCSWLILNFPVGY